MKIKNVKVIKIIDTKEYRLIHFNFDLGNINTDNYRLFNLKEKTYKDHWNVPKKIDDYDELLKQLTE